MNKKQKRKKNAKIQTLVRVKETTACLFDFTVRSVFCTSLVSGSDQKDSYRPAEVISVYHIFFFLSRAFQQFFVKNDGFFEKSLSKMLSEKIF